MTGEGLSDKNVIEAHSKHLVPYCLSNLVSSKKIAFTLAEVLITLGIIGIVAAMTIPTLVSTYSKKVLHSQFLKTYSDIQNAAKLFQLNNDITVYEFSHHGNTANETLKELMSCFKGTKEGDRVNSDYDDEIEGSVSFENAIGYTPKNLAGKAQKIHPCDKTVITEEIGGRFFSMDDPVSVYNNPPNGPKLCVDINGRKGPNIYGYDWFVFTFTKDGGVKPYIGREMENLGPDMNNPETACSYTYEKATYTCAYYAATNTSPEDPSKNYWEDFLK